jgi:chloramphenicol 3-O-phosphotransferase
MLPSVKTNIICRSLHIRGRERQLILVMADGVGASVHRDSIIGNSKPLTDSLLTLLHVYVQCVFVSMPRPHTRPLSLLSLAAQLAQH